MCARHGELDVICLLVETSRRMILTDLPLHAARLTGTSPAAAAPQAMADLRELSAIAIDRTRMPMVISDPRLPDNPIVLANRAFLESTGYSAAEVIGRNCRFLQGTDTDPAAVDQIRAAVAGGTDLTIELLNYRRDGSRFWNRLLLSAIRDDDGAVIYFFASQMDVTAERRVREMASGEHRLLREVDHRAKNALALVQGIVRLTRADDAAAYSRAVQGRVDALAQAHGILSDAHWQDVPIARIAATVLAPYGSARASAEGPMLKVAAAHVQPLVLLLYELVANAAQHGGLSAHGGTIAMTWHQDDDRIVVSIRESGGPPLPPGRVPGFGLTMVDAFVRRQLRGNVDLAWHPDGLRTELTFPAGPADDNVDAQRATG
ncbi:MAG: PAS domain-containing protein [Janthinobacterium lividum]